MHLRWVLETIADRKILGDNDSVVNNLWELFIAKSVTKDKED